MKKKRLLWRLDDLQQAHPSVQGALVSAFKDKRRIRRLKQFNERADREMVRLLKRYLGKLSAVEHAHRRRTR